MIAVIDYDAGNIMSVCKALDHIGAEHVLTRDAGEIEACEGLILPGVGAFGDAMNNLQKYGLTQVLKKFAESGKPFLGICLGMQLLFEKSEESEGVEGLSLLKGECLRFPDSTGLKIPQIGWNSLTFPNRTRLFDGLKDNTFVYFVHSYYVKAQDPADVAAVCDYGIVFHAAVERNNIFGCQFHPEKSSEDGLKILRNFVSICASNVK